MSMGSGTYPRVSNGRAILVGTLWVNIPVAVIMFGGWFGLPFIGAYLFPQVPALGIVGAGLLLAAWIVLPFTLAWTWWSCAVPRWRLWAMQRTDDWPALELAAIGAGLIWDEETIKGRLFARTEIWSRQDRERETELLRKLGRPPRRAN